MQNNRLFIGFGPLFCLLWGGGWLGRVLGGLRGFGLSAPKSNLALQLLRELEKLTFGVYAKIYGHF